jgi:hypothetical protein
MKITKRQIRSIIKAENHKIRVENHKLLSERSGSEERVSEMREFSASKGGKRVMSEGRKIRAAGEAIRFVSEEHTGNMRRTLANVSEFVEKLGTSLEGIGLLQETESATSGLPTTSELKQLHREIARLEK